MKAGTCSAVNLCFSFDPKTWYCSGVLSLFLCCFLHLMDFQLVETEAWRNSVEHV